MNLYFMITLPGGSTVPIFQKRTLEPWGKWPAHGHKAVTAELLHMVPSDSRAHLTTPAQACWGGVEEL